MGRGDGEPAAKRVRFGTGPGDGNSGGSGGGSGADAEVSSGRALQAPSVVEVRFVLRSSDIRANGARSAHDPKLTARPEFLHQIFPDNLIYGYREAVAALYYTCASLTCWLDVHTVPLESNLDGKESSSKVTDIAGSMKKYIHAGCVRTRREFEAAVVADDAFFPPFSGQALSTYERRGKEYHVYKQRDIASSEGLQDYHKRMQMLMFMHIDGANYINDADPRWELFMIFECVQGVPRYFVGYATVYPFSALRPGCTLDTGISERIRVSQVFIMPCFQRDGHGGELLRAICKDAARRNAIEITVEDPSEGFRLLRDSVDLPRAYDAGILQSNLPFKLDDTPSLVRELRSKLLITKAQARRCLEVHQIRFVDRSTESEYKPYRLWVKRRLYNDYLEVLDAYSGDDRKAKLGNIYDDFEKEYLITASRLDATYKR